MLSLQNIRSVAAAQSYFSKDNYYSKDKLHAEYFGEVARMLSLSGEEVTPERFAELLSGRMAEGETVPKHAKHRPGYDLTFSAPKSVSISALAVDDKQLNDDMLEAHRDAVNAALCYIEKNLATVRTREKTILTQEKTGNILAVKFEHDTSRELDPQLHTHCVIVNATYNKNDQWRALNNEEFYNNRKLAGVVYQAHLAKCLTEKGYEVEQKKNGTIELSGYTQEQLEHFSTRREQIKEYMARYDLKSPAKAEEATLKTRCAKVEIDRVELYDAWRQETKGLNITKETPERRETPSPIHPFVIADSAVKYAVDKLSERNSVLMERELITTALIDGLGHCTVGDIEKAYRKAHKEEKIHITKSGTVFTSRHYDTEKENIALMQQGKERCLPITDDEKVTEAFIAFADRKGFSLSEGQQTSARLLLTTGDRVVGVEGYAGTGKTTMLEVLRTEAEKAGYTVKGYCPSSAAAAVLNKETGMETATLFSHLMDQRKEGHPPTEGKEVWVIDEASMVSTLQANELLKAAEKQDAKVVFLGDRKQLASVEAGKPFAQLIDNGMAYEKIIEIRRQKDPLLKKAVYEAMDPRKIVDSLKKLDIAEIPDRQNRLDRMVGDYLGLPSDMREKTLLLTATNDDRRTINEAVRAGLQKEGTLTGPAVGTTILVSTGLTRAELDRVENYRIGQELRFGRQYKKLGVKNGDRAKIVGVDQKQGFLTVKTTDERQLTIDIFRYKNIELFNTETRSMQKGDTIRFTKNDKQQNLMNGQQASVVHLDPEKRSVMLDVQGIIRTMQLDEIRYLDHAYATTVHSSQGLTCDRVLINMDTKKEQVLGQESYYVGISRAKLDAFIYTDAPKKLPDILQKSLGQKSAVEEKERTEPVPRREHQPAQKPEPKPAPKPSTQEPTPPPKAPPQPSRKEQIEQSIDIKDAEIRAMDSKLRDIHHAAQPLYAASAEAERRLGGAEQQLRLAQQHDTRMKELQEARKNCGMTDFKEKKNLDQKIKEERGTWEHTKMIIMRGEEPDRQQLEKEIKELRKEIENMKPKLEKVAAQATPLEEKKSTLEKERNVASNELYSIERSERKQLQGMSKDLDRGGP